MDTLGRDIEAATAVIVAYPLALQYFLGSRGYRLGNQNGDCFASFRCLRPAAAEVLDLPKCLANITRIEDLLHLDQQGDDLPSYPKITLDVISWSWQGSGQPRWFQKDLHDPDIYPRQVPKRFQKLGDQLLLFCNRRVWHRKLPDLLYSKYTDKSTVMQYYQICCSVNIAILLNIGELSTSPRKGPRLTRSSPMPRLENSIELQAVLMNSQRLYSARAFPPVIFAATSGLRRGSSATPSRASSSVALSAWP